MKLSDIAKLAGVSKATASRALSNPALVSQETRQRVLDVAREYNFRPNAMAQAVASRKSGLIGFCLYNKSRPYFGHTFFAPILDGITGQAKEMNYHVVLAITDQLQDTFEERFIEDCIEGAILSTFAPASMVEVFRSRGTPVVVVNDELSTEHTGFIIDDNYGGTQKLMSHMIDERGYTSIAIVTDRISHPSYLIRYLSYLDALSARGLEPYSSPALPEYNLLGHVTDYNRIPLERCGQTDIPRRGTPVILSSLTPQSVQSGMDDLLHCPELPRAIFCTTDSIAISAILAIKARGLRVPEDIAVCGYDDIEAAATNDPALTTICVNRDAIGRSAMKLLKKFIDDPTRPSETICLQNTLVVRQST